MAERIPRDQTLKRTYGPGALFATAYGHVGSSIYFALGVVALFALGLTPLAFILAGILFLLTAATYAEAAAMLPEAGGSAGFGREAFNELVGFLAGWAQLLAYVVMVAIAAHFVPGYLSAVWEPLGQGAWSTVVTVSLVTGLAALHVSGAWRLFRPRLWVVALDLLTAAALILAGAALVLSPDLLLSQVELGTAPGWGDLVLGTAVAMVAFTGIEAISSLTAEARRPTRVTALRSATGLIAAVVILYALIPAIALSAMPVVERGGEHVTALGTTYIEAPVIGIVDNLGLGDELGSVARVYVGLLATAILVMAANSGLIGIARQIHYMGRHRQAPERLRQIHPRFGTPYVALLGLALLALILAELGDATLLATIFVLGSLTSMTVSHAAVIRLRRTDPDAERPWKAPLSLGTGSRALPVTALVGGMGTLAGLLAVAVMKPGTLLVAAIWIGAGVAIYTGYRRACGLPLTRAVEVVAPTPLGVEEVEYDSVLVAFDERSGFSDDVVAIAARLAAGRRRAIHVHSMITVPSSLPLDSPMKRAESEAASKIERAKLIAGQRATGEVERVRPAQAGYSIAEKARRIRAAAIVVGLRERDGAPVYDDTVKSVLAERPCRVIVVSPGAASGAGERREEVGR